MRCMRNIKRGSTVEFTYSLPLTMATGVDSIKAQLRLAPVAPETRGVLVDEFAISELTPTATHRVWLLYAGPLSTIVWDLGTLFCDILHVMNSGDEHYSESFMFDMIEAVTER